MEFLPKAFFLTFFKKQISCCHGDHLLVNFIGLRSQGWKHHLWLVSWALYLAASQRVFFKGGTQGSAFPNNSAAWVTLNREDLAPFHWWGVALTSPALKKKLFAWENAEWQYKAAVFCQWVFSGTWLWEDHWDERLPSNMAFEMEKRRKVLSWAWSPGILGVDQSLESTHL